MEEYYKVNFTLVHAKLTISDLNSPFLALFKGGEKTCNRLFLKEIYKK